MERPSGLEPQPEAPGPLEYAWTIARRTNLPESAQDASPSLMVEPGPLSADERLLISLFRQPGDALVRGFLADFFALPKASGAPSVGGAAGAEPIPAGVPGAVAAPALTPASPKRAMSYTNIGVVIAFGLVSGVVLRVLAELVINNPHFDFSAPADLGIKIAQSLGVLGVVFLAAYLAWYAWPIPWPNLAVFAASMAVLLGVIWGYPYPMVSDTYNLSLMHMALLAVVMLGVIYVAKEWGSTRARLGFVQFFGESVVYYSLISFGGGIFISLTVALFYLFGLDAELFYSWGVPILVVGAIFVACWLASTFRKASGAVTSVLAAVFTPVAILLVFTFAIIFAVVGISQGELTHIDREFLILMDALLCLVFALVIFRVAARDQSGKPSLLDWLQTILVIATLLLDVAALGVMLGRVFEYGLSPNKTAALGENIVLLVNLAGTAWYYLAFLGGRRPFEEVAKWQAGYLPVFGLWALAVVVGFPPMFGFR